MNLRKFRKLFCCTGGLFLFSYNILAQVAYKKIVLLQEPLNKNEIAFSLEKAIQLPDFKGVVEKNTVAVAMAYTGINFKLKTRSKKDSLFIDIQLYPYFDIQKSWVMPEHHNNRVLNHEQGHFKITAINCCKLYKELLAQNLEIDNVAIVQNIYQKYIDENRQMQDLYDEQTKNGTIASEQARWDKSFINELISNKDCYK